MMEWKKQTHKIISPSPSLETICLKENYAMNSRLILYEGSVLQTKKCTICLKENYAMNSRLILYGGSILFTNSCKATFPISTCSHPFLVIPQFPCIEFFAHLMCCCL